MIGDKRGNEVGARRKLNDAFLEILVTYDEAGRNFSYTIDEGPGPLAPEAVERYVGSVKLFPVTATGDTFVLWTSEYKAKDDAAVSEFCNPIYAALLKELAAHFG